MVVSVRVDHVASGSTVEVTVATVFVRVDLSVTVEVNEEEKDPATVELVDCEA
jgi:hypothetical protein